MRHCTLMPLSMLSGSHFGKDGRFVRMCRHLRLWSSIGGQGHFSHTATLHWLLGFDAQQKVRPRGVSGETEVQKVQDSGDGFGAGMSIWHVRQGQNSSSTA